MSICILCDKEIKYEDNKIIGKQSGDEIHADCYKTWLIESIRGNNT